MEIAERLCECGKSAVGSMLVHLAARFSLFKPMCGECAKKHLGNCGCGKPATTKMFGIFDGMGVPTSVCAECDARLEMGEKTVKEVLLDLSKQLQIEGMIDESFGYSSYGHDEEFYSQKAKDLKFRWIACYAVTGNSEGHYIHIDLVLSGYGEGLKSTVKNIALGKTFQGRIHAFAIAARAAELLGA